MLKCVPDHRNMEFDAVVHFLVDKYAPKLRTLQAQQAEQLMQQHETLHHMLQLQAGMNLVSGTSAGGASAGGQLEDSGELGDELDGLDAQQQQAAAMGLGLDGNSHLATEEMMASAAAAVAGAEAGTSMVAAR